MKKAAPTFTQVDIFSGIGGFLLAGEMAGFTPVIACEIERFAQTVLQRHFPGLPIVEDVHDLSEALAFQLLPARGDGTARTNGLVAKEAPTVLTGGFPFQVNYSRGEIRRNDPRSLWDQFARVARELRPAWVVVETVPRLVHLGIDDAAWDLERAGYAVTALSLPAHAVDCPIRKDRLYLVGGTNQGPRLPDRAEAERRPEQAEPWPAPGPRLHRVAERLPGGLDYHEAAANAYGDATVPQSAAVILRSIREAEERWVADSR